MLIKSKFQCLPLKGGAQNGCKVSGFPTIGKMLM